MLKRPARLPDAVPVLARGKHSSPRKGGCFMEFASFMAGEEWSDHPSCTHPLLASLARDVNDNLSDSARGQIVGLIPEVIGLVSDDPMIDLQITIRAAVAAAPVAPFDRQKSLAVALLRCDRELARHSTSLAPQLRQQIRCGLASTPEAARWAEAFAERSGDHLQDFARTAQRIVHLAVSGIANACVSDGDNRLVSLLTTCIDDVRQQVSRERELAGPAVAPALAAAPSQLAEPTGRSSAQPLVTQSS